ncbi:hypothetical protein LPJ64_004019 [Coemansia asiatica]|uniref:HIT-type domain-containing protein n=1 Tax=Coemansia asiatica TaxID=1052880 RepID=A0A9W7XK08_9FUNG|nr:hypothetical protein LPJ64_004019 [Coemansia asiatica]KAJ2877512.1 hypothetical protein FB639_003723 [Coemansia asiatica]
MSDDKNLVPKAPARRVQSRYAGKYYWDKTTLEQRRRARLQMLERENYTMLPDFESMPIASDVSNTKRQGRPPRTPSSAPKARLSKIVISTADEGLKRANRKETRALAAQKVSFADILASETGCEATSHSDKDKTSPSYYYLTCIATPQQGSISAPARHFCSICGYKGLYTCVDCGMRYCSLPCKSTHVDTRCLKHVA